VKVQDDEKRKDAEYKRILSIYGPNSPQAMAFKEKSELSPEKSLTMNASMRDVKQLVQTKKLPEKKLLKDLSVPNIRILDGHIQTGIRLNKFDDNVVIEKEAYTINHHKKILKS